MTVNRLVVRLSCVHPIALRYALNTVVIAANNGHDRRKGCGE
jgi:hypothetical protein